MAGVAHKRSGRKKHRGRQLRQLELPFGVAGVAATSSPAVKPEMLAVRFWPGFMGRRAPAPLLDEPSLNTKRAAHYLRRSPRWLELVRHKENSPPWRKVGGLFEYYASQLDWWREQIADL